jgi:hypothetical protein
MSPTRGASGNQERFWRDPASGLSEIGRQPTALPVNGNPILILILALINWVEGSFHFTYVESMSERCENRPIL